MLSVNLFVNQPRICSPGCQSNAFNEKRAYVFILSTEQIKNKEPSMKLDELGVVLFCRNSIQLSVQG